MIPLDIIVFSILVILLPLMLLIWIIIADENEMVWVTIIQAILGILGILAMWMIFFNHH